MGRITLTRGQALLAALVLVVAGAVGALAATGDLGALWPGADRGLPGPAERQEQLEALQRSPEFDRFLDVIALIRSRYVQEDVDVDRLLVGATKGAVQALGDPYSLYFDASELEDFDIALGGTYAGIGVKVEERDGYVVVLAPFPGTPGATARFKGARPEDPVGLRRGDRIVAVDGRDVVGLPVDLVARMIRGPEGTVVRLTVIREGPDGPRQLEFEIRRTRIEIPTVEYRLLPGGIGYLRLTEFLPQAPRRVEGALRDLRRRGMRGLVLDLRDNPGGWLNVAQEVAELFVPRGPLVHIVSRGDRRETLYVHGPGFDLPLVVLVNRGTASAAEILAGAIRDRLGAPLVGDRTFGKGSVQTRFTFNPHGGVVEDGEGPTGLKLTTARYLTPNGSPVDGVGIAPDVPVPWPDAVGDLGDPARDPQLRRALQVLRARLGG